MTSDALPWGGAVFLLHYRHHTAESDNAAARAAGF